jgi:predicted enzyme related to lactoylglutathione lyase/uncharacterized protein YndB with AHSA1/START domain
MPDIMHLVRARALPKRAYQALTTVEGIRAWWTRDAELDSQVGGTGKFRFSYKGVFATTVRIEDLEPSTRVVWKTVASFRPEWVGTTIVFDLRVDGDDTVISFAHRDFKEADEAYAVTTTGWGYYLVSLQQYLETGEGAPSPDIDFARVIKGVAMKNNPVGWFEIYVQDMERAKPFYEKVFGVSLAKLDNPEIEMWAFPMEMEHYGAPGALVRMPGFSSGQNSVLVYFSCEDCASEEAKVERCGGKVVKKKFSIGEYGHISLVTDTEGNMIGLHSMQ